MSRIAVVYAAWEWPLRVTLRDQLYAFLKYSGHECIYVNASTPWASAVLRRIQPDVVIFHTLLLAARWGKAGFARVREHLAPLRDMRVPKAILPQDEFFDPDAICDFIRDFGVTDVFSIAPPTEWPLIYAPLGTSDLRMHSTLTGFLDDDTVARVAEMQETARPIDVGYRAWAAPAWLGRHGRLKVEIGARVAERAGSFGIRTDISNEQRDTLLGDAWLAFLKRCRYTLGVEGGASVLDRSGSIRARTEAYVASHPGASIDEIEEACFPGLDGAIRYFAISPRHLEACATRTGQILVEGEYGGVLKPWVHYVPLKADFGNLDEVLAIAKRGEGLGEMTEQAYVDIVASGRFSARRFVQSVLEALGLPSSLDPRAKELSPNNRLLERASWSWVRQRTLVRHHLLRPLRHVGARVSTGLGRS